jgi:hypothetical protein
MTRLSKALEKPEPHHRTEREFALLQDDRGDSVFDTLIEVLEEMPEALSVEYSSDLLCDLVRSRDPGVTTEEIVAALEMLGARAIALREHMQDERRSAPEPG